MFVKTIYTIKDVFGFRSPVKDNLTHINEAVKWLCRAQDATPDGGVSHSYAVGKGWAPSYPETTGYIIPTLLNVSEYMEDVSLRERALQMADWELEVQLESGAIPALSSENPVVFDTGQVIFGWLAAYNSVRDNKYIKAALKAGDWLLSVMDDDGVWRRYGNPGSDNQHTYNVRTAWALIALANLSGKAKYADGVAGFMDWVLDQEEKESGWFHHNCLNENLRPLLHTIAYTSQGLLESGISLKDERFINAAARTSDALMQHVDEQGRMPGRFNQSWNPAAKWSCLTGMAQTSIVWQKLDLISGNHKYSEASAKVNNFLKSTQAINADNVGIRGGIRGSYPISGEYGKYRTLNWATKFFIDALLLNEFPNVSLSLY
ncbi:hypothetical protein ACFLZQ_03290 [Thermodesulfobacteriota bacterium]